MNAQVQRVRGGRARGGVRPHGRQALDSTHTAGQGLHPRRAQRVQAERDGRARAEQTVHKVPLSSSPTPSFPLLLSGPI